MCLVEDCALAVNDVFHCQAENASTRVLHIAAEHAYVYAFVRRPQWRGIQVIALAQLYAQINDGLLVRVPKRTCSGYTSSDLLNPGQRSYQYRAWRLIEPLLLQVPVIYQQPARSNLVRARAKETGIAPRSILNHLFRYWEGGMTLNALSPWHAPASHACSVKLRDSGFNQRRPR